MAAMHAVYAVPDEALLGEVVSAANAGRFADALALAAYLELALTGPSGAQFTEEMEFYCMYLLLFLLESDLEGARHMWRRSPAHLKVDNTQFAAVWQIGQCLWQRDIGAVYKAIRRPQFSPAVAALAHQLKAQLLQKQQDLVSLGFSAIRQEDLATRLDCSSVEELRSKIQTLGWEIDASGFVLPKAVAEAMGNSGDVGAHAQVKDSVEMLARLTQYVCHFEQKNVKVEKPSAKGDHQSSSSSSSSSSVV